MPPPKLLISLPVESKWRTGSSMESWHELAPQRSATQIDLPSLSISTALVDPQVLPSGSFAQSFTVSYGLGREFVGFRSACAPAIAGSPQIRTINSLILFITASLRTRPQDPLILFSNGSETFIHESLHALATIGFRGVNVALGICGNTVYRIELSWLPSAI